MDIDLTLVVRGLHLSDAAKILSCVLPPRAGHWSMSTLRRSISIPLVPLTRDVDKYGQDRKYRCKCRVQSILTKELTGEVYMTEVIHFVAREKMESKWDRHWFSKTAFPKLDYF